MDATKETPSDVASAMAKLHLIKDEDTPRWLVKDDKGNEKVNAPMLGYQVMTEVPMIRSKLIPLGARYDKTIGAWRLGDLGDFLESYITKKLESVHKWSIQKMGETKKFILIKTFDGSMTENPFDESDPALVNFKNGTFNLRTMKMQPHNPKDYILQYHNYALPTNAMSKLPPETNAWLLALTGDDLNAVEFLYEMLGFCFYRSYDMYQTITILKGDGGNGKSKFLSYVQKVLGSANVSNESLDALGNKDNRFASSNLYQKEANIFADIADNFVQSTGLLKTLSGADKTDAEFKGQNAFSFRNFAKLIFSGNKLPAFADFTDGFERRLYVVPFPTKIDDAFIAAHPLSKIYEEIPQAAAYSLYAFSQRMKKDPKRLTESGPMLAAKDKWLKDANSVARFVEECCHIDPADDAGDSSQYLYEKYKEYCTNEGSRILSQPKFTSRLETLHINKANPRINGQRIKRYMHLIYDGDQND